MVRKGLRDYPDASTAQLGAVPKKRPKTGQAAPEGLWISSSQLPGVSSYQRVSSSAAASLSNNAVNGVQWVHRNAVVPLNPRAVRFGHSTISRNMRVPGGRHVPVDDIISEALYTRTLPAWPPILAVEVTEPNGTSFFRAIDGNRRLYVARVAWRRGLVGAVEVLVCDRNDPRVSSKYWVASNSSTAGHTVRCLCHSTKITGSMYCNELYRGRDFQEDLSSFLSFVAKRGAHDKWSTFCRRLYENFPEVDTLHKLTPELAERLGVPLSFYVDVQSALREPCAVLPTGQGADVVGLFAPSKAVLPTGHEAASDQDAAAVRQAKPSRVGVLRQSGAVSTASHRTKDQHVCKTEKGGDSFYDLKLDSAEPEAIETPSEETQADDMSFDRQWADYVEQVMDKARSMSSGASQTNKAQAVTPPAPRQIEKLTCREVTLYVDTSESPHFAWVVPLERKPFIAILADLGNDLLSYSVPIFDTFVPAAWQENGSREVWLGDSGDNFGESATAKGKALAGPVGRALNNQWPGNHWMLLALPRVSLLGVGVGGNAKNRLRAGRLALAISALLGQQQLAQLSAFSGLERLVDRARASRVQCKSAF